MLIEIKGWVEADSIEDALLKLGKHYVALITEPDSIGKLWIPDPNSRMWVGEDGGKTT